jgi:hypothetical protein
MILLQRQGRNFIKIATRALRFNRERLTCKGRHEPLVLQAAEPFAALLELRGDWKGEAGKLAENSISQPNTEA